MAKRKYIALAAVCVLVLLVMAAGAYLFKPGMTGRKPETVDIVIRKQDGRTVQLSVKTADTPLQWQKGLMFVKKLDGYDGMLFDFKESRFVNMWMKNTYIPLDMLFFDSDRRLACIHENAVPHDQTLIGCCKPVTHVLEISGGRTRALGIALGDVLE
ncbi:MAG: DUF192 domain-containing protein [Alphaproteobacteria bacterium]|nr:DUF192 domain-containing protein [Alphaproteobacteria bacterium]